jgi:hypothetical protein
MKENYDKISKTLPQSDVQSHMEKFYGELISSLKPPKPLDAQRKDHGKKKVATRRRSYGEDKLKKKDLPPKPPGHSQIPPTESGIQIIQGHHEETSIQVEGGHHLDENGSKFSLIFLTHLSRFLGFCSFSTFVSPMQNDLYNDHKVRHSYQVLRSPCPECCEAKATS